jgi:hypothetical protein
MKYAVEMALGDQIYIPSFIMTGSTIQELTGEIHSHTNLQHVDLTGPLLDIREVS